MHRVVTDFGVENLAVQLYREEWEGWRGRSTLHLLTRHQAYLTNTTAVTEENYRACSCSLGAMVASVMDQLGEEDIVWSGEWLRLQDGGVEAVEGKGEVVEGRGEGVESRGDGEEGMVEARLNSSSPSATVVTKEEESRKVQE